jgi:hypothetical protein
MHAVGLAKKRGRRGVFEDMVGERAALASDILALLECVTEESERVSQSEFQEIVRRLERKRRPSAGAGIQPVITSDRSVAGAEGAPLGQSEEGSLSEESGAAEGAAPSSTLDIFTEKVADGAVL